MLLRRFPELAVAAVGARRCARTRPSARCRARCASSRSARATGCRTSRRSCRPTRSSRSSRRCARGGSRHRGRVVRLAQVGAADARRRGGDGRARAARGRGRRRDVLGAHAEHARPGAAALPATGEVAASSSPRPRPSRGATPTAPARRARARRGPSRARGARGGRAAARVRVDRARLPVRGAVAPAAVAAAVRRLLDMGCAEVSLGDTIGAGTARATAALLRHLVDGDGHAPPAARPPCSPRTSTTRTAARSRTCSSRSSSARATVDRPRAARRLPVRAGAPRATSRPRTSPCSRHGHRGQGVDLDRLVPVAVGTRSVRRATARRGLEDRGRGARARARRRRGGRGVAQNRGNSRHAGLCPRARKSRRRAFESVELRPRRCYRCFLALHFCRFFIDFFSSMTKSEARTAPRRSRAGWGGDAQVPAALFDPADLELAAPVVRVPHDVIAHVPVATARPIAGRAAGRGVRTP